MNEPAITEKHIEKLPQCVKEEFLKWRDYMYNRIDFYHPESEIHSFIHCERVLLYALIIGEEIYGDNREILDTLAHAAIFHDTRRIEDGYDTGHGGRAALHYKEFSESHPEIEYREEAAQAMRWHDRDDKLGIEHIRKVFANNPSKLKLALELYAIFKDADALDRYRLGKYGLDPKFLRTTQAKSLMDFAHILVVDTMDPDLLRKIDSMVSEVVEKQMKSGDQTSS